MGFGATFARNLVATPAFGPRRDRARPTPERAAVARAPLMTEGIYDPPATAWHKSAQAIP